MDGSTNRSWSSYDDSAKSIHFARGGGGLPALFGCGNAKAEHYFDHGR
jgi:hypothetical protein